MKIRMNVLRDAANVSQTHYGGVPTNNTTLTIKQNGNIVVSGLISDLIDLPLITHFLNDNHGHSVEFTITPGSNYNSINHIGTIDLNIRLRRITDYVTFELILENPNYNSYANLFTVYGYDLGNDINFGDTGLGEFTGIPNGDNIALANNVFNPIYGVENTTDYTTYGQENGTSIVRHNPNFNIGLIPLQIDNGSGTIINNDLRYGCSSRFIAIINPITKEVRVINANSNHPATPVYNIQYGVKRITEPNYNIHNSAEFTTIIDNEDIHIAKYFSLDVNEPVIQNRVIARVTEFIPSYTREINGIDFLSFTGALAGTLTLGVDIDDSNVFKYWSNNRSNLSPISGVLIKYNIYDVPPIGTPIVVDEDTAIHYYQDTDVLGNSTTYVPYNTVANNYQTIPIINNTNIKVEIDLYIIGSEYNNDVIGTGDNPQHGYTYFITSIGNNLGEDYTTIGSIDNLKYRKFIGNLSAPSYNFTDNGHLSKVVTDVTVPKDLYLPLYDDIIPTYNSLFGIVLTNTLVYSATIVGYIRQEPLYYNSAYIEFPYNAQFSITSSECGILNITVFRNIYVSIPHQLDIQLYDVDTDIYTSIPGYPTVVNSSSIEDVVISETLDDGIYKIIIDGDEYIFFAICSIINCYIKVIKNTVCGCCEHDDCKAKAYYRFNEFMVLWNTYMSLISVNNINMDFTDTSIVPYSELLDLIEISKVYDRIQDICENCKDMTKKCKHC